MQVRNMYKNTCSFELCWTCRVYKEDSVKEYCREKDNKGGYQIRKLEICKNLTNGRGS